jgi:hypothetical protein
MSTQPNETEYRIPLSYRRMENMHIVFWLLKDVSWCMIWKPLGIVMIFPTLIITIVIAWRTRQYVSELCHNLAITIWITANSYWMISEFLHFDEKLVWGNITYKQLTMLPFCTGLLILAYYYLYWKPRHKDELETL